MCQNVLHLLTKQFKTVLMKEKYFLQNDIFISNFKLNYIFFKTFKLVLFQSEFLKDEHYMSLKCIFFFDNIKKLYVYVVIKWRIYPQEKKVFSGQEAPLFIIFKLFYFSDNFLIKKNSLEILIFSFLCFSINLFICSVFSGTWRKFFNWHKNQMGQKSNAKYIHKQQNCESLDYSYTDVSWWNQTLL